MKDVPEVSHTVDVIVEVSAGSVVFTILVFVPVFVHLLWYSVQ